MSFYLSKKDWENHVAEVMGNIRANQDEKRKSEVKWHQIKAWKKEQNEIEKQEEFNEHKNNFYKYLRKYDEAEQKRQEQMAKEVAERKRKESEAYLKEKMNNMDEMIRKQKKESAKNEILRGEFDYDAYLLGKEMLKKQGK